MRNNLKNARKAKGMTQQGVADYLGIGLSLSKDFVELLIDFTSDERDKKIRQSQFA